MKMTRSATRLAKPISWVTTIMVMPSLASSVITSRTSLIISGSKADIGDEGTKSVAIVGLVGEDVGWPEAVEKGRRRLGHIAGLSRRGSSGPNPSASLTAALN